MDETRIPIGLGAEMVIRKSHIEFFKQGQAYASTTGNTGNREAGFIADANLARTLAYHLLLWAEEKSGQK
jgi:hypothetical protein